MVESWIEIIHSEPLCQNTFILGRSGVADSVGNFQSLKTQQELEKIY